MRPTEIALGSALTPKCTWSTQQKVEHYNLLYFASWKSSSPPVVVIQEQLLEG